MIKRCISYGNTVMSHCRDIYVVHTISNKVIFDIPLHFEKDLLFKDIRIETGRMIVTCEKPTPKDCSLKLFSVNKAEQ